MQEKERYQLKHQKKYRDERTTACREAREEHDRGESIKIARTANFWAKTAAIIAIIAVIIATLAASKEISWLFNSIMSLFSK